MTVVAHAGGTGWDEILLVVLPFAISATIFCCALRVNKGAEHEATRTADGTSQLERDSPSGQSDRDGLPPRI